ncbi:ABC transporter substrate-binding protein [Thermodesulfobacteriota bacterium]
MPNMNYSNRFIQVFALLLCIGLLLTFTGTATAAPKGGFNYATSGSQGLKGLDSHTGTGATFTTLTSMIHGKLFIKDKDGRLQPDVAESWEFGPNWMWLKVHLNKNARFHDGVPVTAEDVKFSFERASRKELKWVFGGEFRRKLDRVEVNDKHTVTIYNKSSYPALPDRCAKYLGIAHKAYIDKVGDVEYSKKTIGAGPFKLIRYKQDSFTEAEANTDHYRKVPNVKNVRYMNVQENATRVAMLKTGEIDIALLSGDTFREFKNHPEIRLVWSKNTYLATLAYYDLAFPKENSPLHDVRVRQACSIAINRKLICEKVLHGKNTPWGDILAPYNAGFDSTLKPDPYDPEKAMALLKEAGYPQGFETTMACTSATKLENQAIVADLSKVGIDAKLSVLEHAIWSRNCRGKKLRGLARHPGPWWVGRSHPASAWNSHLSSKSPWSFYTTPEVDKGLAELEKLTDEKEIGAKARAMSKYYRGDYIRAPLWSNNIPFALRKTIKFWAPTSGWVYAALFEYVELAD